MNIKGRLYRLIMRVAHTYHWHYAPPVYPEGDTQLRCKWCGFRATIQKREDSFPSEEQNWVSLLRKGGWITANPDEPVIREEKSH